MSDHEEVVEDDNEALRATTYAVAMDEVAFNPEHAVGLVSGTTRDSELRSNDSDGAIEVGGVTGKRGGGSAGDVRTKVVAPAKEMAAAVMNFINSIVGAGIIGLPYALKQCGFFMGIILISCVAQMTAYSVNLLVRNGNHVKKFDYEELCEHTLGKPGFYTVSVFMAILAYGAMIAYFIVIGDTMTTIFQGVDQSFSVPILHERTFVISLIAVVVVLPLIMLKDMSKLSFSSGLSVLADVFLVIIVVARAPTAATPGLVAANISDSADAGSGSLFSFANPNLFGGIGAISFAYVCQHSSFIVHNTLTPGPARQSRWNKVTHISIGVALFLCLVLAIGGYVTFGESTQADILNNFGCTDVAINIARVLLAVTMFFTYPMEQFVVRHSVHAIICRGKGKVEDHNVRYYVITCLLWASSLGIGLAVEDLGIVLELTGAIAASMLGFILPAVVHFKIHGFKKLWSVATGTCNEESPHHRRGCRLRAEAACNFFAPLVIGVFGAIAMLAGVASSIINRVTADAGATESFNCSAFPGWNANNVSLSATRL